MTSPVHTIGASQDAADADRMMIQQRVSCVPVLGRDGAVAGVLSRTDLVRAARMCAWVTGRATLLELPSMCAGDLMSPKLISVAPDTAVSEAARRMLEAHIHRLFVLEGHTLVGVLSTKDLMRAVMEARVSAPITAYMSSPVVCVEASEPVVRAFEELERARIQGVVATEGGMPIGIFTQAEALEARGLPAASPLEQAISASMLCLPSETVMFRAAAFAVSTRARRVLAIDHHHIRGILTGLDFARALLPEPPDRSAAAAG